MILRFYENIFQIADGIQEEKKEKNEKKENLKVEVEQKAKPTETIFSPRFKTEAKPRILETNQNKINTSNIPPISKPESQNPKPSTEKPKEAKSEREDLSINLIKYHTTKENLSRTTHTASLLPQSSNTLYSSYTGQSKNDKHKHTHSITSKPLNLLQPSQTILPNQQHKFIKSNTLTSTSGITSSKGKGKESSSSNINKSFKHTTATTTTTANSAKTQLNHTIHSLDYQIPSNIESAPSSSQNPTYSNHSSTTLKSVGNNGSANTANSTNSTNSANSGTNLSSGRENKHDNPSSSTATISGGNSRSTSSTISTNSAKSSKNISHPNSKLDSSHKTEQIQVPNQKIAKPQKSNKECVDEIVRHYSKIQPATTKYGVAPTLDNLPPRAGALPFDLQSLESSDTQEFMNNMEILEAKIKRNENNFNLADKKRQMEQMKLCINNKLFSLNKKSRSLETLIQQDEIFHAGKLQFRSDNSIQQQSYPQEFVEYSFENSSVSTIPEAEEEHEKWENQEAPKTKFEPYSKFKEAKQDSQIQSRPTYANIHSKKPQEAKHNFLNYNTVSTNPSLDKDKPSFSKLLKKKADKKEHNKYLCSNAGGMNGLNLSLKEAPIFGKILNQTSQHPQIQESSYLHNRISHPTSSAQTHRHTTTTNSNCNGNGNGNGNMLKGKAGNYAEANSVYASNLNFNLYGNCNLNGNVRAVKDRDSNKPGLYAASQNAKSAMLIQKDAHFQTLREGLEKERIVTKITAKNKENNHSSNMNPQPRAQILQIKPSERLNVLTKQKTVRI